MAGRDRDLCGIRTVPEEEKGPKKIVVVGLGKMGVAAARTLAENDVEVIAVDNDRDLVEKIRDEVASTMVVDGTDIHALEELPLDGCDAAIVTMGDQVEASILCTLRFREMKVEQVFTRAVNQSHAEVLEKIGAHFVVQAEKEMGERLARNALNRSIQEYLEPFPGLAVAEVSAPPEMDGKSLQEGEFRDRYKAVVLAIKRGKKGVTGSFQLLPKASATISRDDRLWVAGRSEDLRAIDTSPDDPDGG